MKKRILSLAIVLSVIISVFSGFAAGASAAASWYYTTAEKTAAAAIVENARNFKTETKITVTLPEESLSKVMELVFNDNPELFHISTTYTYSKAENISTGQTQILSVHLRYTMSKEEYSAALNEVNQWTEKVLSLTNDDFSDREYALFFHDYICANFEYDLDFANRTVYDFIKDGKGVCLAYTHAYSILLKKAGIDVSFAVSREMNHIWNVVKIDGEWYHVDATWDDPVGQSPGMVRHIYFLKSDTAISAGEESHYGWTSPYRATATDYDSSFISGTRSPFAFIGEKWYYITDGDLYTTDDPFTAGILHTDLNLRWNVWDSTSFYTSDYSALIAVDGKLYLNSDKSVICIDPASKASATVYTYSGKDGYIYGFTADMGDGRISGADFSTGKIVVSVGTAPSKIVRTLIIDLSGMTVYGDANGDNKVSISDAAAMLKYIAKWDVAINIINADMDSNSKVNISDVSIVLKKIAGWNI